MPQTSFQNFDLEFYESHNLYQIKARSGGGEARHSFSLPFTWEEAQATILTIEKSLSGHTLDLGVIKKFGGILFETVFQKDIRALFKSSLALALAEGNAGLRTRLHLQEVPALAHLPWEYLYDISTNQFMSLNRQTPMVRYLELPRSVSPLRVAPPLRLLIMISSPSELLALDIDAEKGMLQEALAPLEQKGLVQIVWLEQATVIDLQNILRRDAFHVFHFIGHGDFDPVTQQGWLAFEDEAEAVDRVNAEQVGALLNNHPALRLVVLNSCKGGRNSLVNPFAGTAATFVQLGIPAVAAMQFAISNEAAIQFARTFYGALADHLPVDVAATEARVALFSRDHHFEWGTPVLFMRSSDGALFIDKKAKNAVAQTVSRRNVFIYSLVTLLFAFLTFVLLNVIPKSTIIDLEIFAQSANFSLPAHESEETVPLLQSGLWAQEVSIENFQPLQMTLNALGGSNASAISNPISIRTASRNGKVTFMAAVENLSVQELTCAVGGKVNLRRRPGNLQIDIQQSSPAPQLILSVAGDLDLWIQDCTVTDGAGHDLTPLFADTVRVELHELSRSLQVAGQNGKLLLNANSNSKEETQFLVEQLVENLAFSKNIYRGADILPQSTIDSISISRNVPLDNLSFKSRNAGDLELAAEPNRFAIYNLSEIGNGFKLRAQGRLQSLTIGRDAAQQELVPGFLSFITQNPTTSVLITWLGWVATVVVPLLIHFRNKNKNEGNHG